PSGADLTFASSQDARSQSERQIQSSTGINILLAVLIPAFAKRLPQRGANAGIGPLAGISALRLLQVRERNHAALPEADDRDRRAGPRLWRALPPFVRSSGGSRAGQLSAQQPAWRGRDTCRVGGAAPFHLPQQRLGQAMAAAGRAGHPLGGDGGGRRDRD